MKIALFHNAPSGGAKRAIFEWTRRLAEIHEIDVFTMSGADHTFCDIRPYVRAHYVYEFTPRRLFGSPWGRLNQLQRLRGLKKLISIGRQIAEQIDEDGYDILFSNTCQYTIVPTLLQFVHVPSIHYLHEPVESVDSRAIWRPYDVHDKRHNILDRYDPLISFYREQLASVQSHAIRRASRLLANSHYTRSRMKSLFSIESFVCNCGVDLDIFCPKPAVDKDRFILSVGELSPRKGFDFIVDSMGRIPGVSRLPLRLACNSVQRQEETYVRALADRNHVDLTILTNLNSQQLVYLYNRALLCVYAPVREPFGLVPLEAMACGLPVVAVREGGVPESVVHEHTGLLVERDPEQFAAAILQLLDNNDLALEYGGNGRKYVLSNWSWERSVAELNNHFTEVGLGEIREQQRSTV
jgi:glycosyltransferase involved in cell wall biosynthesis